MKVVFKHTGFVRFIQEHGDHIEPLDSHQMLQIFEAPLRLSCIQKILIIAANDAQRCPNLRSDILKN